MDPPFSILIYIHSSSITLVAYNYSYYYSMRTVFAGVKDKQKMQENYNHNNNNITNRDTARSTRLMVLVLISMVVLVAYNIPEKVATTATTATTTTKTNDKHSSSSKVKGRMHAKRNVVVDYECPSEVGEPQIGYDDSSHFKRYHDDAEQLTDNMTEFLETFRTSEYDLWKRTYEQVKDGMYHWKSTRYARHLASGDSIYESACGIGLNLLMTVEILEEVSGIDNLRLYGNEYVEVSASRANQILGGGGGVAPPARARTGSICRGDSTDLSFVPPDSFDLVFTGYLRCVRLKTFLEKEFWQA